MAEVPERVREEAARRLGRALSAGHTKHRSGPWLILVEAALQSAERRGAEAMREKAAAKVGSLVHLKRRRNDWEEHTRQVVANSASAIRSLPLPGDPEDSDA